MPEEKLRPTYTFTEDRLAELKAVLPEAFADGTLNWDVLRDLLTGHLDDEGPDAEHFGLSWPGKREARRLAAKPSGNTLRPAPGQGMNEDTTHNLYLEGDNLEVLKLLQKSYAGQVKMIYIDPPYNTGNDFVYKDDFSEPSASYLRRSGQVGERGEMLTDNPKTGGRFHTNWLNMMYPRLKLAKFLLSGKGVIFVSIDDNELHNLREVMDEIFGPENFVGLFVWVKKRKGSHLSKTTRSMTEYIVCYARNKEEIELFGEEAYSDKWQPLAKRTNKPKQLSFTGGCVETPLPNGIYEIGIKGEGSSALKLLDDIEVLNNIIINDFRIFGPFVWTQGKLDEEVQFGTRIALSKKFGLNVLRHDQDEKIKRPTTLLNAEVGVGTNEDANEEIQKIFGAEGIIDYPKPVSLIHYLVRSATNWDTDAIVVDFFSGSSTTAQAVLQLNREDGGNRQFIMVQVPAETPLDSPARKLGYKTITQIGEERIRCAIAGMGGGEQTILETRETFEDLGFKVLTLAPSNFRAWKDYKGDDLEDLQQQFALFDDSPLIDDWTPTSLLTEVLLLEGFPLDSTSAPQLQFTKNTITLSTSPAVAHHLWACFDDKPLHPDTLAALALTAEDVFVCLDSALDDNAKLRLSQLCTLKTI